MLAPWKKSCGQPRQHIKNQRHYFADKICLVKVMVFPVVMYGCESWVVKKAERWRILSRVPWTARWSNQSILKEINPEYSFEGLTLKLWYFGHLMWRADSLEKILMLERSRAGEGGDRGWDGWMASLTQWTQVWASSGKQWRTWEALHASAHEVAKSQTWLGDWIATRMCIKWELYVH